ncbi:Endonuclease/exonuclease/phosphatase, partial [Cerioporus squamosus]
GGGGNRHGRTPKRRTKGRIGIASLNMRGYGTTGPHAAGEKWLRINQLMRDQRIAVIGLQETHLNADRIASLNELFGATMKIFGSPDLDNETGARGVAFAVNTRIVSTEDLSMEPIVPGRAAILSFRWTGDRVARVLNIYAPNATAENETFWETVMERVRASRLKKPEALLGDFNVVEEAGDRLPPHPDQVDAVDALRRLTGYLRVSDGWRVNNPREKAFTYLQTATGSQSRIDRVYVTEELMRRAEDWTISGPGFPTDHRVVSVSLANYKAPGLGKGRWALPVAILSDGEFARTLRQLGLKLQGDLGSLGVRSLENNPQKLYHTFKCDLKNAARKRAKSLIPKIDRRITALEDNIKCLLESPDPDEQGVAILQERLAKLEIRRFDRKRRNVATRDWLQGETMTKYWSKLNAPQLPS